jgi:selenocysteine lyase/cysteine desulfurase
MMFVKQPLLDELDVPKVEPAPDIGPERMETGTINHEGVVGAAAAVEFLASIGEGDSLRARLSSAYTKLHARAQTQMARLWNGLAALDGVQCFGPDPSARRTPTIGFVVDGVSSDDVATQLAARGVFVSHGDFYAQTVIERLGLAERGGLVRAGCACYTTDEEIDALLRGVTEIVSSGLGLARSR